MKTKQMFRIASSDKKWMQIKPSVRTKHRMSRSRFRSGKNISEAKMASILKQIGYKVDAKGNWSKKAGK